ncbi:MAG: aminotransferase class V-fold PLP-dependent enzyme [Planctomycetes bacterium]|nr:aminotransferase class V-fold PLP-dependent enzyme [Planctomycetota bacterium]
MIYLDHAATSFPKPPPVLASVCHWYEHLGVGADRGDSGRCLEVRHGVDRLRTRIGQACGMPAERVAFVSGATEALNLALRAVLRPGDRVLTTAFEHSSVARPLRALEQGLELAIEVLAPSADGGLAVADVEDALQRLRPRLFVFTHASNVTGAMFDAAAFCELARRHGALSLVDASQTAGFHDIDVGADLIAASCHKSMLSPPGVGFLAAAAAIDLASQKQGGTGGSVALDRHPEQWPQLFEAGTPNTPALLGCLAALDWIEAEGRDRLAARCLQRTGELEDRLAGSAAVRLIRPPPGPRTAVTSLLPLAFDPAELGAVLDAADVHVRSGFHCAPWIHHHLGTGAAGTVRLSPGPMISAADIETAAAVVAS